MFEDQFGLADEEYWIDPWRTRKELQRPFMRRGQEALIIGAPSTVAISEHRRFPVAVLRTRKLADPNCLDLQRTAIITAMDLDTDALTAAPAFLPTRRPPRSPKPPSKNGSPAAPDPNAMTSEGHTLDLAQRLRLPTRRANYLITLILQDRTSNRCRMKVVESAIYQDPAVDEFLQRYQATSLKPPPVHPPPATPPSPDAHPHPLPDYTRRRDSPDLPDKPGLRLSAKRVIPIERKTRCPLLASFRLPVQPHHIAQQPTTGSDSDAPETAVVPISLLLTGSVRVAPCLLRLAVPSYEPLETQNGISMATGYFALDLCRMLDLVSTPQTHFLYAFAGESMTGPTTFALVGIPGSWRQA